MAETRRTVVILAQPNQMDRLHPESIAPPGMAEVSNLVNSRSDLLPGLRPDVNATAETHTSVSSKLQLPTGDQPIDFLNSAEYALRRNDWLWLGRLIPYAIQGASTRIPLYDEWSAGTITADGVTTLVSCTSDSDTLQQKVWPGCYVYANSTPNNWYEIDRVFDGGFGTTKAMPALDAVEFTVVRTWPRSKTSQPIHTQGFNTILLVAASDALSPLNEREISGPWWSNIYASGDAHLLTDQSITLEDPSPNLIAAIAFDRVYYYSKTPVVLVGSDGALIWTQPEWGTPDLSSVPGGSTQTWASFASPSPGLIVRCGGYGNASLYIAGDGGFVATLDMVVDLPSYDSESFDETRETNDWSLPATGSDKDLYAIAVFAKTGSPIVVGEAGTILVDAASGSPSDQTQSTVSNLRAIASDHDATTETIVVVGDNDGSAAVIFTADTSDLTTWTARTSGLAADSLTGVCWGPELFVACGTSGKIITSPAGVTWTSRTSTTSEDLAAIAVSADRQCVVAVGAANTVIVSADGITWAALADTATGSWVSIVHQYREASFTMLSASGAVKCLRPWHRHDGVATESSIGTASTVIWDLLHDGTVMIATGLGGIWTETIGVGTWTQRLTISETITAVAYDGSGLYVAVGTGGVIYTATSPTMTWTSRTSGVTDDLWDVEWDGTTNWWACGDAGTMLYSTDGITWNDESSAAYGHLRHIALTDGTTSNQWIRVLGGYGKQLVVEAGSTSISQDDTPPVKYPAWVVPLGTQVNPTANRTMLYGGSKITRMQIIDEKDKEFDVTGLSNVAIRGACAATVNGQTEIVIVGLDSSLNLVHSTSVDWGATWSHQYVASPDIVLALAGWNFNVTGWDGRLIAPIAHDGTDFFVAFSLGTGVAPYFMKLGARELNVELYDLDEF